MKGRSGGGGDGERREKKKKKKEERGKEWMNIKRRSTGRGRADWIVGWMTGVGTWKWVPDASWDVALFFEVWSVSRGICNRPDGNDLVDNREANRQITWIIHLSIKSIEFPPSCCFIFLDVILPWLLLEIINPMGIYYTVRFYLRAFCCLNNNFLLKHYVLIVLFHFPRLPWFLPRESIDGIY